MWKLPDTEFGDEVLKPTKITNNVKQVAIIDTVNAAILKEDNTVWPWGHWSSPYPEESVLKPRVTSFTDTRYVSATSNFLYMVRKDGSLCAAGNNLNKDIGIKAPYEYI